MGVPMDGHGHKAVPKKAKGAPVGYVCDYRERMIVAVGSGMWARGKRTRWQLVGLVTAVRRW